MNRLPRLVVATLAVALSFLLLLAFASRTWLVAGGTVLSVTDCSTATEFETKMAILAVDPTGGVLTFDCGAGAHVLNVTTEYNISSIVAVSGNGLDITLDRGALGRHFVVGATGELTLDGLTLRNGLAAGAPGGGAIYVIGGKLHLNNMKLSENHSANNGGAISLNAGEAWLTNTVLISNTADGDGGALIVNSSAAHIQQSSFTGNDAENAGAIAGGFADLTLADTTFTNNSGIDVGGAIATFIGSTIRVQDGVFAENGASDGGALWMEQTALAITGTEFISNMAQVGGGIYGGDNTQVVVRDAYFVGNMAQTRGGAIFSSPNFVGPALEVRASTFTANRSPSGAAIYAEPQNIDFWDEPLTIENSTIHGNLDGRALEFVDVGFAITHTTITGNAQGALRFRDDSTDAATMDGSLRNSIVFDNGATPCTTEDAATFTSGQSLLPASGCGTSIGGNALGVDPLLGALQENGGETLTRLPAPNSEAIDFVTTACLPTDQRGVARPYPPAGACDAGSVEVQGVDYATETPTETPTGTPTHTLTQTPTQTPTQMPTSTPTQTPTPTPTVEPIGTMTNTLEVEVAAYVTGTIDQNGGVLVLKLDDPPLPGSLQFSTLKVLTVEVDAGIVVAPQLITIAVLSAMTIPNRIDMETPNGIVPTTLTTDDLVPPGDSYGIIVTTSSLDGAAFLNANALFTSLNGSTTLIADGNLLVGHPQLNDPNLQAALSVITYGSKAGQFDPVLVLDDRKTNTAACQAEAKQAMSQAMIVSNGIDVNGCVVVSAEEKAEAEKTAEIFAKNLGFCAILGVVNPILALACLPLSILPTYIHETPFADSAALDENPVLTGPVVMTVSVRFVPREQYLPVVGSE